MPEGLRSSLSLAPSHPSRAVVQLRRQSLRVNSALVLICGLVLPFRASPSEARSGRRVVLEARRFTRWLAWRPPRPAVQCGLAGQSDDPNERTTHCTKRCGRALCAPADDYLEPRGFTAPNLLPFRDGDSLITHLARYHSDAFTATSRGHTGHYCGAKRRKSLSGWRPRTECVAAVAAVGGVGGVAATRNKSITHAI